MNCVIYSRVSTEEQDNERAINELKEYAAYKKYNLLEVFEEKVTGTSKALDRIEFSRMLEFINANEVNVILVWELSRVGRKMSDVINTVEYFNERKINIYAKKENMNTLNEHGERDIMTTLLIGILSSFAEVERDTFKKRSRSGIRANVLKGGSGTGVIKAYGYRKEKKMLVIDEDEAKVVKQIFEKFLSGLGTTQIANYLNNNLTPTKFNKIFNSKSVKLKKEPKKGSDFKWVDGTVYSILKNSIYCGKRKHMGEVFEIEAIISMEDFEKVQALLKSKYNKVGINRKYPNLFKAKIICGKCGRTYFMHRRADKKDYAYKCLSKRYHESCGNVSVNIDKLVNCVYPLIISQIEFGLTHDNSAILNDLNKAIEIKEIEINNTISELEKTSKDEKRLLELLLKDTISTETYTERYNELISEKTRLTTNLSRLKEELEISASTMSKVEHATDIDVTTLNRTLPNIDVYKQFVSDYIDYIKVYEVKNLGKLNKEFTNKQDIAILIELKALLNPHPYFTIISQRSKKQLIVNGETAEGILSDINNSDLDYIGIMAGDMITL